MSKTNDFQTWINENRPAENMHFSNAFTHQVVFLRDTIPKIFFSTYEDYIDPANKIVVGSHTSKSISLPVLKYILPECEIILRNNFYNWKVSVIAKHPVKINFMNLFDPTENISSVYCEGFNEEDVFGSFNENKCAFTIDLADDYTLYTFLYLLQNKHLKD
jgi:hypothetical protein